MTVLTLVSFAVLFAYSSADETKENVVATDGQCYVALRSPLSWADAENDCASKGGHLASVKSEDVSKALRERLNASSSLWIGATYDGLLKKWRWSDGSPFEYAKWKQGHPVNKTALCSVLNTDGEWTSNDCGVPLRYHTESEYTRARNSESEHTASQHIYSQYRGSNYIDYQYIESQHNEPKHT
ncbi:type II antifreeze protein [Aphelenchoides avenae]|nr:type II antifreeze protein [Aphelenchus avenae]